MEKIKKHNAMRPQGAVAVSKPTILACLLLLGVCSQAQTKTPEETEQEKAKLRELVKQEWAMVKQYSQQPEYRVQVVKDNCRVIVKVDDIPLSVNLARDGRQNVIFPLNDRLFYSGEHTVSVEIYPRTTESTISKRKWMTLDIILYPEKGSDRHGVIAQCRVPDDIGERNLSVYRDSVRFHFSLPFDHRQVLHTAKDLRTVPELENKVVAHYNKVRDMMIAGDYYGYNKMRLGNIWTSTEMYYLTEKELEAIYMEPSELFRFNCQVTDWKVAPIENYEMLIGHHGKVVYLRRKGTMDEVLQATYTADDGETYISTLFLILYMPEGSDELLELY